MIYTYLGRSGLNVSRLGFGNWIYSQDSEESQNLANDLVKYAFSQGINFFDTAENYDLGAGERQLGRALKNLGVPRSDYVLSSKIFDGTFPENTNKLNNIGTSRKRLVEGVDRMLENLDHDYMDVLFCHKFDTKTPIEETVYGMKMVIDQGKALYWATSNWPATKQMEAMYVADKLNCPRPIAEQNEYNMLRRDKLEKDFGFNVKDHGLGFTAWGPLAMGVLTGRYNQGIPKGSRWDDPKVMNRHGKFYRQYVEGEGKIERVVKLGEVADRLGVTLPQFALAWNILNPDCTVSLLAAEKVSELEENVKSVEVVGKITKEILVEVEEILGNRPEWGYDCRDEAYYFTREI